MNRQLALAIQLNDEATFDEFCWGEASLLQQQLCLMLSGEGEHFIYLWGVAGSGKSHLLQACCQTVSSPRSAMYLPLKLLLEWGPTVLEGLDDQTLIAIDDLEVIAGVALWEEAVFHLYNRIRDQGTASLLISGTMPPPASPIQLPDLRSRLSGGLVVQVPELQDNDKIKSLRLYANKRGFDMPESVGQFLLSRCARNMHDLHALLNRLDEASLRAQRRITIPFVKHILDL